MLLVSQGTSPSMNEAETEAQITSQTNLGTGMRARYQMTIEVELDLLAVDTQTYGIITSLTCKTRFRQRIYQPLYASRHFLNIRSVFITMDRDKNLKTCEKPSEKRVLLESFMDCVFINSSNEKLGFCSMIRPFREIVPTLLDWKSLNSHRQPVGKKPRSNLLRFMN